MTTQCHKVLSIYTTGYQKVDISAIGAKDQIRKTH
jgi:hypothetical protein